MKRRNLHNGLQSQLIYNAIVLEIHQRHSPKDLSGEVNPDMPSPYGGVARLACSIAPTTYTSTQNTETMTPDTTVKMDSVTYSQPTHPIS